MTHAEAHDLIDRLKAALEAAICSTARVSRRCIEFDPAGSTYELDWLPCVKEWAALCDLDLDRLDLCFYEERHP